MKIDSFYGATVLFSEKSDGDMRQSEENVRTYLKNAGMKNEQRYVTAKLEHDRHVAIIKADTPTAISPKADALVTNVRGIILGVGYADCPPVVVVDPEHWAYAIAHCGWKGLERGVLSALIDTMTLEYGTNGARCFALIGPGIEQACYPVDADVASKFPPKFVTRLDGKFFPNLREIVMAQLRANGVTYIQSIIDCTACDIAVSGKPKYFSGRRDKLDPVETNMAFMTIR